MTRTTLKDLARAAGCSITTVSHALNGTRYVRPETRARIEALARAMDYRPDPIARMLQGQDSLLIGHILSGLHDNAFFALVALGADQRAQESGYATVLSVTDGRAEAEERAVRLLLEKRVNGIIFTTPVAAGNVEAAVAAGVATVMIERPLPVRGAHAVMVDHRAGLRDLTRLLIDQGHRILAYIGAGSAAMHNGIVERQRLRGFRDAVREAGLTVPPAHVCLAPSFGMAHGRSACQSLLDRQAHQRPSALVVGSDLLASGVLQALYERGLRVPDDVSVVSCDDTQGPYLSPPLTEVEPRTVEMGRQAVELIVAQGQHTAKRRGITQRILLEPRLHVRSSTRAIPASDTHASA